MEQLKRVSLRTRMISGSGRNQQRLRFWVVRRCIKIHEHRPTPYRDLHNLHDHHKRNVLDTRDAIGSSLAPTHETYLLAITLRSTAFIITLRNVTFALGGDRKAHLRPPEGPQETPGGPTKGPGTHPEGRRG